MRRDDELGRLTRVFDAMAGGVRAREARLREQLRELQSDVSLATTEFEALQEQALAEGAFAPGTVLAERYELLHALVMRLLAKEPGQRPADATMLLEQLAELG